MLFSIAPAALTQALLISHLEVRDNLLSGPLPVFLSLPSRAPQRPPTPGGFLNCKSKLGL